MDETLEAKVRRLIAESEFLRAVASVRRGRRAGAGPRRAARSARCSSPRSPNWKRSGTPPRTGPGSGWPTGSTPAGSGTASSAETSSSASSSSESALADGVEVIAGVSNSTLVDCVIGHNAVVKDVRLLANYVVAADAVVVDCGRVTCSAGTTFGNGERVPVALEGGGREVEVFAEMDVATAATAASPGVAPRRTGRLPAGGRRVPRPGDRGPRGDRDRAPGSGACPGWRTPTSARPR